MQGVPRMNIENKLDLLIHQVNLLKKMINVDQFHFFMFILNHDYNEKQMNTILKVIFILDCRFDPIVNQGKLILDNNKLNNNASDLNDYIESLKYDFLNQNDYKLDLNRLFQMNTLPSIEEFKTYASLILGDNFKLKHLLLSLKNQHINPSLCDFLLNELNSTSTN